MGLHDIPQEHQAEYNATIEQLYRFSQEIDGKLPTYLYVLKSEDAIKKLVAIVRLDIGGGYLLLLNVAFFAFA